MPDAGRQPEDLELQVQRVTRSLKQKDQTSISDEVIERTVRDAFAERDDAKIKDFVGLLAERAARERLRTMAADDAGQVTG